MNRATMLRGIREGALCSQERMFYTFGPRGPVWDAWLIAVCCTCLNRVSPERAEPVIRSIVALYDGPRALARSDFFAIPLRSIVAPLGSKDRRAMDLTALSAGFLHDPAAELARSGRYIKDAVRLIVGRDLRNVPRDEVLQAVRSRYLRTNRKN